MKVYEALADAFVAEGTRAVFTMMGDANMYWLNAMSRRGTCIYDVRHEGAGLAMADGWGRATGEPGVCSTTGGPGTTQLATTMVVAARARTPLVAFCGDSAEDNVADAQRFDQARFAAGIEAAYVRIKSAACAHDAVRRAFAIARAESRPVMLGAPENVQQELLLAETRYEATPAAGVEPLKGDPAAVERAADALCACRRPVLLLGRGALRAGAGAAALGVAERAGALVATTLHAKNWLEDPFHLGIAGGYGTRTARKLLRGADCLVAVGATVSSYTSDGGKLFESAKIVQIDLEPGLRMGNGRQADVAIRADARVGLEQLSDALDRRGHRTQGLRTNEIAAELEHAYDDDGPVELDPGTVDPREVCRVLDDIVPGDIALVLGSGQQIRFPTMLMRRPRPLIIAQHHFGCIGQGLTTAMGAVAATGRPAFTIEGDAGVMMHLAELETAVRYGLPVLVVVMNDEALGAEFHKSRRVGLDERLTVISTPDLGAVARSLGGAGTIVRSVRKLRDAVKSWAAEPQPALVDVRISRSVLSIPYRRARGEDV